MGNFLTKRVADPLRREPPQLKTFCTLSPIPGLMAWLQKLCNPASDPAHTTPGGDPVTIQ